MVSKTLLRETISEVLGEYDLSDQALEEALVDRLTGIVPVVNDEDKEDEDE